MPHATTRNGSKCALLCTSLVVYWHEDQSQHYLLTRVNCVEQPSKRTPAQCGCSHKLQPMVDRPLLFVFDCFTAQPVHCAVRITKPNAVFTTSCIPVASVVWLCSCYIAADWLWYSSNAHPYRFSPTTQSVVSSRTECQAFQQRRTRMQEVLPVRITCIYAPLSTLRCPL